MRPILGGNFSCISCSWNVEKLKRQHQSSLQRQARDTKCLLLIVWWWSKKKKYGMFFDTYVLQYMTNLKKVVVKLLKRKNSKKEGKFMRHFATTYKKTTFIFILIQPWDCISLRLPGKNESKWRVKTRRILQRKCVKETKYLSSFSLCQIQFAARPSIHSSIHLFRVRTSWWWRWHTRCTEISGVRLTSFHHLYRVVHPLAEYNLLTSL